MVSRHSEIAGGAPLIVSAGVGLACSASMLPFYAIGPLTKPLTQAYGWMRSDVQLAAAFCIGIGALVAPIVGMLVERFGPRRPALIGLLGVGLSFFAAAAAGASLPLFYLAFLSIAILGGGSSPVGWTRGIATSFDQRRGLALGLAMTGTGICAIVAPQLITMIVQMRDVRTALFGVGLLPIAIGLPVAFFFFRPRPLSAAIASASDEAPVFGVSVKEALRGHRFWVLLFATFSIYLAQAGVITNLIPALTDGGLSAQQGANLQSVLGMSIVVGRILVGYLIDRVWAPGVAAVVMFLPAFSCLVIPGHASYELLFIAVALVGLAAGAELDLLAFLCARYFGLLHYARLYALLYGSLAAASGIAPFAFAAMAEHFGSYRQAFSISASLFTAGGLLVLLLGRYPAAAHGRD